MRKLPIAPTRMICWGIPFLRLKLSWKIRAPPVKRWFTDSKTSWHLRVLAKAFRKQCQRRQATQATRCLWVTTLECKKGLIMKFLKFQRSPRRSMNPLWVMIQMMKWRSLQINWWTNAIFKLCSSMCLQLISQRLEDNNWVGFLTVFQQNVLKKLT